MNTARRTLLLAAATLPLAGLAIGGKLPAIGPDDSPAPFPHEERNHRLWRVQELHVAQFEQQLPRITAGVAHRRKRIVDLIGWNLPGTIAGFVRCTFLLTPGGQRRGVAGTAGPDTSARRIPDACEIAARSRAIRLDVLGNRAQSGVVPAFPLHL